MILFFPVGGLANRMRVIDSAVNYISTHPYRYKINWILNQELNCNFTDLWHPIYNLYQSDSFISYKILRICNKLRRKSSIAFFIFSILEKINLFSFYTADDNDFMKLHKDAQTQKLGKCLFTIVECCSIFCFSNPFRKELFSLTKNMSDRLYKEISLFKGDTVGIHIRRTDNAISIKFSPTKLFVNEIEKTLLKSGDTMFYLCSDDIQTKEAIKEKFGEQIILSDGVIGRNSREGIKQAVLEMYALSHTKKIIGSYYSSFSEMASYIGNIPLVQLKSE